MTTPFPFHEFPSLENSYREIFMDKIHEGGFDTDCYEWLIMEKAHGSNFSFWTDGNIVIPAKRTSFLKPEEYKNFFDCAEIVEKYSEPVKKLFEKFRHGRKEIHHIAVFGELVGGSYEEFKKRCSDLFVGDKAPKKKYSLVQKGVHYHPFREFYAFDIIGFKEVTNADGQPDFDFHFISKYSIDELFKEFGFYYAKPLFWGPLEKCLAWSEKHYADDSVLPEIFGFPHLDNNVREGHVIRPVIHQRFNPYRKEIVALKHKNEKFEEKKSERKSGPVKTKVVLPPKALAFIEELRDYITENRYDAVVSKIGEVTKQDFTKIFGLYKEDVFKDWKAEHGEMPKFEKAVKREIDNVISIEVRDIVRKKL